MLALQRETNISTTRAFRLRPGSLVCLEGKNALVLSDDGERVAIAFVGGNERTGTRIEIVENCTVRLDAVGHPVLAPRDSLVVVVDPRERRTKK